MQRYYFFPQFSLDGAQKNIPISKYCVKTIIFRYCNHARNPLPLQSSFK